MLQLLYNKGAIPMLLKARLRGRAKDTPQEISGYQVIKQVDQTPISQSFLVKKSCYCILKQALPDAFSISVMLDEIAAFVVADSLGATPELEYQQITDIPYYVYRHYPFTLKSILSSYPFSLSQAGLLAWKIRYLLVALQTKQLTHGNVVPENVVVNAQNQPLLINFESAYFDGQKQHHSFARAVDLPPQAFLDIRYKNINNFQLLALLFQLHFGETLLDGENEHQVLKSYLELFGEPNYQTFNSQQLQMFFRQPAKQEFVQWVENWKLVPVQDVFCYSCKYDQIEQSPSGMIDQLLGSKLGSMYYGVLHDEKQINEAFWLEISACARKDE